MCTAVRYNNLFGRNFDLDIEYERNILFVGRNYPLKLRHRKGLSRHYAFMGMGLCTEDFPLCYDGVNEYGLACASLNFPLYAKYSLPKQAKENLASFEVIPYILSKCRNVSEAVEIIKKSNITNTSFSDQYPNSPLHWIIADKSSSVVLESTEKGMKLHKNKVDILTNSPGFDIHMLNLSNYMNLSCKPAKNTFSKKLKLSPYSFGMGSLGLPGDNSSMSRFVRAAFNLHNSPLFETKEESIAHFFRLLYSVAMTKGSVITPAGKEEYTQYSCCIDLENKKYIFTSYNELSAKAFSLSDFDIECRKIIISK